MKFYSSIIILMRARHPCPALTLNYFLQINFPTAELLGMSPEPFNCHLLCPGCSVPSATGCSPCRGGMDGMLGSYGI